MLYHSKDVYIKMLTNVGAYEEAAEKTQLDTYDPLFKKRLIHPEESPIIKEYNTMLLETKMDLSALQYATTAAAIELKNLADTISLRLSNVEFMLAQEKEIRDDMKMLCNAYEDFEELIIVDNYITVRTCDYQKGVFKSKARSTEKVAFEIQSITGNGEAGNKYVLDAKGHYLEATLATDKPQAFRDDDLQTAYEYQRITVDTSETLYGQYMYKDTLPARCDIVLKASQTVNECQINGNVFTLNGFYFSEDGVTYDNALLNPIKLDNSQSIPSTGYLAFPSGKYIKLACESISNTSDKIGFDVYVHPEETVESKALLRLGIEDTKPNVGSSDYDSVKTIQPLTSAKRSMIRLNEIQLLHSVYENNTSFTTDNLLRYPVQSVALYADTYIPEHFKEDDYLIFELSINNKVYQVVPINSALNGIKVIKTSTLELGAHYGAYVEEPITDVRLTLRFKCPNANESAVVKHVRLLVGEKYES